jgi:Ca2+-binding RTX toxin-like protein
MNLSIKSNRLERFSKISILMLTMATITLVYSNPAFAANVNCAAPASINPDTGVCTGTLAADTITGTNGEDEIAAGPGNDNVNGGQGDDAISGNAGNDPLNGQAGDDEVVGGAGVDTINGNQGDDALSGGQGNDALNGQAGVDTIFGGAGGDTINGGIGPDGINCGGSAGDSVVGFNAAQDVFINLNGDPVSGTPNNAAAGKLAGCEKAPPIIP